MSMLTFATISAVLVAVCSADPLPQQFASPQFIPQQQFSSQPPVSRSAPIPVISRTEERHDDGAFNYQYKTADGQTVQETGSTKRNFQNDGDVIVKQGSYSFTSPEGITYSVQYVADEFGFHPVATHLPTPVVAPPVRF